ncbi:probable intron-encoded LAGLIDADG endonuclease, partial (mitochondrion) [Serendipita indica DSM 11827]
EYFTNDQLYFSSLTVLSFSNLVFIASLPFKNLTKTNLKKLEEQYPYSPCTSLVTVGCSDSLNSTIGSGKITNFIRNFTSFSYFIISIIFGLLLSDGWLQVDSTSKNPNARFGLKQSIINFAFIWHVFQLLSHYCQSLPFWGSSIMRGKLFTSVTVQTRTYPFFNFALKYFYFNGIKVLPPIDWLFSYINPISLAFLITGDGAYSHGGLILCTDNFTDKEVVLLISVLMYKFDLDCTLQYNGTKPRIYIRRNSMTKLRDLVEPYIIPSMKYKLTGESKNSN